MTSIEALNNLIKALQEAEEVLTEAADNDSTDYEASELLSYIKSAHHGLGRRLVGQDVDPLREAAMMALRELDYGVTKSAVDYVAENLPIMIQKGADSGAFELLW